MDLTTVSEISRPRDRSEVPAWRSGDAWLGGGTWLFSEPNVGVARLIDLAGLGWTPLQRAADTLTIAATCTLGQLAAADLPPVFAQSCRALLGSFKIWHAATVGGNLCMALAAGPMAALLTALDGVCVIWTPDGGERRVAVGGFILAPQRTVLRPGEVLRAVEVPLRALGWRTAFRQISLAPQGRSGALLIGTRGERFGLTITAATRRPIAIRCDDVPAWDALRAAIPDDEWYDDVHGAPDWRRHVTLHFAAQILHELAA